MPKINIRGTMKRYKSPYLENEKRTKPDSDRREDSLTNALQPIMNAFIKYLEVISKTLEHKIQAETKNAETLLKLVETFSNMKDQATSTVVQSSTHKKSENDLHRKVREIIIKMRKDNKTYQVIADQLEKDGIPTLSGRGNWHAPTVQNLYERYLKNAE